MSSILVVDDERDIVMALQMLLTEEGYQVVTAHNGKEALERMAEQRPDLVMMDVMMPVLSGPDTIRLMKENPEYARIPIVLMSAARPHFSREVFPWDEFLKKPFELDQILQVINRLLKPAP